MNLTDEDRELLDRHFEQDLTELEETKFQQKLAGDDEFRQAVRLRELIHERVQANGAAQLKEQLKANLASQRSAFEENNGEESESNEDETPVRPLFGNASVTRWAIAASLVAIIAAGIIFLNIRDSSTGDGSIAVEDTTKTEAPVTGGQVEAPTYAGTDTYEISYPITTEGTQQIKQALLVIDETRTEAAYEVRSDTLFVYYPQDIFTETLEVIDREDETILRINEDEYQIDSSVQKLLPLE
ncbi:MAG: hypothetical protein ACFB15_11540 [Cyclobacteriaceae bacterium]